MLFSSANPETQSHLPHRVRKEGWVYSCRQSHGIGTGRVQREPFTNIAIWLKQKIFLQTNLVQDKATPKKNIYIIWVSGITAITKRHTRSALMFEQYNTIQLLYNIIIINIYSSCKYMVSWRRASKRGVEIRKSHMAQGWIVYIDIQFLISVVLLNFKYILQ